MAEGLRQHEADKRLQRLHAVTPAACGRGREELRQNEADQRVRGDDAGEGVDHRARRLRRLCHAILRVLTV